MSSKVMTANLLRRGEVVYLTAAADWSPWLDEATIARERDEWARLEALAEAAVAARKVVGPYLMEVAEEAGRPIALGTREKIRAKGPTVHLQFGKQATARRAGAEGRS